MTLLPTNGINLDTGPFQVPTSVSGTPIAPQTPFIWGQGGARLTPEQILARQQYAQQQMQSDFSPVGSIWEGLGRVANNVTGAIDTRSLDRQQQANAAESDALLQAVLGGDNDAVTAALTSPYASPEVRDFAKMQFQLKHPKPRTPFEFEGLLEAGGYQPGTREYQNKARQLLESRGDPFITATLPSGDYYAGPQSQFAPYLQGQGQPQAAPAASAPPQTLPPDFDFGGPSQPATGGFRPGG